MGFGIRGTMLGTVNLMFGAGAVMLGAALVVAGCKGDTCADGLQVEIQLGTVDAQSVPPVTVVIVDGTCEAKGLNYVCTVPEAGTYQVTVMPTMTQPPFYEAKSQFVDVPEAENCEDPVTTVQMLLQNESGGA